MFDLLEINTTEKKINKKAYSDTILGPRIYSDFKYYVWQLHNVEEINSKHHYSKS